MDSLALMPSEHELLYTADQISISNNKKRIEIERQQLFKAYPDHTVSRFAEYYSSLPHVEKTPSRDDFCPCDTPWALHWMAVLDVRDGPEGLDFVYRLVGEGVKRLYGRNVTGLSVGAALSSPYREDRLQMLGRAHNFAKPVFGEREVSFPDRDHIEVVFGAFPLTRKDGSGQIFLVIAPKD